MNLISKSEMDEVLNIRIIRLASKMSLIFQRETLRPAGIKIQQWRVLVSLAQFGELHLRAVSRYSSQDPAHTSRVIKTMIKQGWVAGRGDGEDRRRIQFTLTQQGEALVREYWPEAKAFADEISALFSEDEFKEFRRMLDRLNSACEFRLQSNIGDQAG